MFDIFTDDEDEKVTVPENTVDEDITLGTDVRYVADNIEGVIDPAGRVKVPDVNVKPLFAFKSPEKVVAGNVEGTLVRYVCDNIAGVILVGDN